MNAFGATPALEFDTSSVWPCTGNERSDSMEWLQEDTMLTGQTNQDPSMRGVITLKPAPRAPVTSRDS